MLRLLFFVHNNFAERKAEARRQGRLRSFLGVYTEYAMDEIRDATVATDFGDLRQRMRDDENYTPYFTYDSNTGITLQDISKEYSFLEGDLMAAVVRYLTAENYLNLLCMEIRTDYVRGARGFASERKLAFLDELEKTFGDVEKCLAALSNILSLERNTHDAKHQ